MDKLREIKAIVDAIDSKIEELKTIQQNYVDTYNEEYQARVKAQKAESEQQSAINGEVSADEEEDTAKKTNTGKRKE